MMRCGFGMLVRLIRRGGGGGFGEWMGVGGFSSL